MNAAAKTTIACLVAVVAIPLLIVVALFATSEDDDCGPKTPSGDLQTGVTGETGKQLAGLNETQLQLARNMIAIGRKRNMPETVIISELMAGATETTLRNMANSTVPESLSFPHDGVGSDHDSVGPHQMRVSVWAEQAGGLARLMDPIYQINWFYDQAAKVPGYDTMDSAALAQAVEVSGRPDAYARQGDLARQLYDLFKNDSFASASPSPVAVPNPGPVPATSGKVIAIDPGHGPVYDGPNGEKTDPATGLVMKESPNSPEMSDVFEVAQKLKVALEAQGYIVVLTKASLTDDVDFRARAEVIKRSGAVLAVAIHTSGAGSPNQATPQTVGQYREYNGKRTTFDNPDTAAKSQQAAESISRARTAAEGHPVETTPITFFGRDRADIPSPGDIPFVSLFSDTVPLVYNELGRDGGAFNDGADGLTAAGKDLYTQGLLAGITQYAAGAAPGQPLDVATGAAVTNCANNNAPSFVPGGPFGTNVVAAATRWLGTPYAWGGGDADGPTKGISDGGVADSFGDFNKVGFDCSGLVLHAIAQASGKTIPLPHLDSAQIDDPRGQPITNPADLRPGDIIQPHPGHIFIWIGNNQVIEAPQSGGVVEISPYTPTGSWKATRFG